MATVSVTSFICISHKVFLISNNKQESLPKTLIKYLTSVSYNPGTFLDTEDLSKKKCTNAQHYYQQAHLWQMDASRTPKRQLCSKLQR